MATHFHPLTIKKITKETADCVSISFDVPAELSETFKFRQGQNLSVKTLVDGEELRRSYSICSAPQDNELTIAVKKVNGGKFSAHANAYLQKGHVLDVMPPTGKFNTTLDPTQQKSYLAFAAGSGITPIISIIKTTLASEPKSRFTLVFGNQSRQSILFFEALEALKNNYLNRFNLIHIFSREKTDVPVNHGRIDADKLSELKKLLDYKSFDDVFICGPEAMLFCVKDFMEQEGLPKSSIHFELFGSPNQKKTTTAVTTVTDDQSTKSKVAIKLDGRTFDFDLAFNSDSILDAALKQGADLPFACKGGVCATCKAKLINGEVSMDVNYALEPEEVEQGFILTCQSHPLTEKVSVDFDVK